MKDILLFPVGEVAPGLLDELCDPIVEELGTACRVDLAKGFDPAFAFHPERGQYHSSELLAHIDAPGGERCLGVTAVDLFIPILTFVFGEAETGGTRAIVSSHRLRQEFYGLETDDGLAAERLAKEALHEIGHMLSLHHCDDYECVMASSHAVEWIDVKHPRFCGRCRTLLHAAEDEKAAAAFFNTWS